MLFTIYRKLLDSYGPQEWWPAKHSFQPREWEVCVGAILTQNTNWKNVEQALFNLKKSGQLSPRHITDIDKRKLESLIKPSGFFKQKSKRLKEFARAAMAEGKAEKHFKTFLQNVTREQLLQINGIGRETADSILLYAANKPFFVIDAYTRRILSRIGMIDEALDYDDIRTYLEFNLGPADVKMYQEFHALLVEHAKKYCTKSDPSCGECPINDNCRFGAQKLGKPEPAVVERGSLSVLGGH